jgi:predicted helicase
MKHFIHEANLGLVFTRQAIGEIEYSHVLACKYISDNRMFFSNKGIPIEAPLYVYTEEGLKRPNLNQQIVEAIEQVVSKTKPEEVFDYVYAVLHSPSYRKKYKDFLKIDFPRVPFPKDAKTFKKLAKLGTELREIHLLESPKIDKFITTYPVAGSDIVEKITYKGGKIFINAEQYFGKVPEIAWNFYIGGYQPAQKWLKDRKGRKLSNEDIEHYQKIIVALTETDKIMKVIDEIDFLGK